jgi:hypothetical protein
MTKISKQQMLKRADEAVYLAKQISGTSYIIK